MGALGHPAFDPIEIGVAAAAGLLNAFSRSAVSSVTNVSVVADKQYARTLFRTYAGDARLVSMRETRGGVHSLKGVQSSSKTVRYRPKSASATNIEMDFADGRRLVVHVLHDW